eukprot:81432-Prymnesium_polylepis.1
MAVTEQLVVEAGDERLGFENVFHYEKDGQRVLFDRCYDEEYGGDGGALSQHPGATISFLTDAATGFVTLWYNEECSESCPGTPPDGCYHPAWKCNRDHQGMCGTCKAYCAPKLYIDAERVELPPTTARAYFDEGEVELGLFQSAAPSAATRRVDIVMPWNADVSFVGIRL